MTELTRRTLIGTSAAGVALGALGGTLPAGAAPVAAREFTRARNLYTRARFARLVRARFTITGPGVRRTVVLRAVTDLPADPSGESTGFRLTFRTTTAGPPQGTYTLRRRDFTATSLFLVPSDEQRRTYQAIVNRTR